jgi:hypothetical protein
MSAKSLTSAKEIDRVEVLKLCSNRQSIDTKSKAYILVYVLHQCAQHQNLYPDYVVRETALGGSWRC